MTGTTTDVDDRGGRRREVHGEMTIDDVGSDASSHRPIVSNELISHIGPDVAFGLHLKRE